MKNVEELRNELLQIFQDVRSKNIDLQNAKTADAVSNSILKSAALEMEHNKLVGGKEPVDFLVTR